MPIDEVNFVMHSVRVTSGNMAQVALALMENYKGDYKRARVSIKEIFKPTLHEQFTKIVECCGGDLYFLTVDRQPQLLGERKDAEES